MGMKQKNRRRKEGNKKDIKEGSGRERWMFGSAVTSYRIFFFEVYSAFMRFLCDRRCSALANAACAVSFFFVLYSKAVL